ncbi:MAG: 50S ribosomal protein L29 [Gammaproteobacteria bacterium]|nr:50S ribosomal protein L29 [Gammaproteobacteria bacterium]
MDLSEMRAASTAERKAELDSLRERQFTLRMQKATGQLEKSNELGNVRRQIAQLLTVMHEAEKQQ